MTTSRAMGASRQVLYVEIYKHIDSDKNDLGSPRPPSIVHLVREIVFLATTFSITDSGFRDLQPNQQEDHINIAFNRLYCTKLKFVLDQARGAFHPSETEWFERIVNSTARCIGLNAFQIYELTPEEIETLAVKKNNDSFIPIETTQTRRGSIKTLAHSFDLVRLTNVKSLQSTPNFYITPAVVLGFMGVSFQTLIHCAHHIADFGMIEVIGIILCANKSSYVDFYLNAYKNATRDELEGVKDWWGATQFLHREIEDFLPKCFHRVKTEIGRLSELGEFALTLQEYMELNQEEALDGILMMFSKGGGS